MHIPCLPQDLYSSKRMSRKQVGLMNKVWESGQGGKECAAREFRIKGKVSYLWLAVIPKPLDV